MSGTSICERPDWVLSWEVDDAVSAAAVMDWLNAVKFLVIQAKENPKEPLRNIKIPENFPTKALDTLSHLQSEIHICPEEFVYTVSWLNLDGQALTYSSLFLYPSTLTFILEVFGKACFSTTNFRLSFPYAEETSIRESATFEDDY